MVSSLQHHFHPSESISQCFLLLQVLISEAGAAPSAAKHGGKASSSLKKDKSKATSETQVEMDSRLLSALLSVSKNHLLFFSRQCHVERLPLIDFLAVATIRQVLIF